MRKLPGQTQQEIPFLNHVLEVQEYVALNTDYEQDLALSVFHFLKYLNRRGSIKPVFAPR